MAEVQPVPAVSPAVLIIDDEASIRRVASRVLQRLGYRTIEAASCADAVQQVKGGGDEIGWVLLDLSLPDASGLETMIAVRAYLPAVPVIVWSGREPEAAKPLLAAGATVALQKPVTITELEQVFPRRR